MSDSISAVEYENMEQKYLETKSKLKKTLQYNERYTIQIQKLNKRLRLLENKNTQLADQAIHLQATARDTSESDVSSPANLRRERANMVELVHSKNQQISDLLKDIEDVENENLILKDKLAEAKDQLATATKEIAVMTETLKADKMSAQGRDAMVEKITSEMELFKKELEATRREKGELNDKLETAVLELKEKETEWKVLLDEKEKKILKLEAILPQDETKKSSSISSKNDEDSKIDYYMREVNNLKTTLSATEDRLGELKMEMENCTLELRQSAKLITDLKAERHMLEEKVDDMRKNEGELKDQLRKTRDRCQTLQKEVEYANKLTNIFENDLTTAKDQMKENGHFEVVANLEEIQMLKIEKLLHEKHIVGLVRDINKLQEMCNVFEIENAALRKQLGITDEDIVDIDPSILSESKKQKKLIDKLQLDIRNAQEDKVKLKLEIKSLKKQIATSIRDPENRQDKLKVSLEKQSTLNQLKENGFADVGALSEENEALRKGLHEILNSVQLKNETSPRELKSDVLERLLRALDVKHISGWYHPAMRLQAELHTLEGVNSELREQLHEARIELDTIKSTSTPGADQVDSIQQEVKQIVTERSDLTGTICEDILSSDVSCMEKIRINILRIFMYLGETETDTELQLQNEFEYLKQHIHLLHKNCNREKKELLENLKNAETDILKVESPEINHNMSPEDLIKLIDGERKKTRHSFNQIPKLQEELAILKSNHNITQKSNLLEIENLLKKNAILRSKLNFKNTRNSNSINLEVFKGIQDSLNENIKKYRQLLTEVEECRNQHALELEILTQKESDLTKENNELKDILNKTLNKQNQESYKLEPNVLSVSQKLADAEVQALSEKHRADHTNNLYELVKEQLKKSEEKFVEFSKYGDGLLQKNIVLQERIAGLEDQLIHWIDPDLYKDLQDTLNSLIKENEKLVAQNNELEKKYYEKNDIVQQTYVWTKEKEQQLLGLKHEIIDLTATSDDKAVIDQLYCDLNKSRSELREHQLQADFLRKEVSNWESRYTKVYSEMENQRNHIETERKVLDKKIGILQDVVYKQRIQYQGCIPLIIQELFVQKLQTINKEKHQVFLSLRNARVLEDKVQSSKQHSSTKNSLVERNCDCRMQQIEYLQQKIQNQERDLQNLESELFLSYKLMNFSKAEKNALAVRKRTPMLVKELVSQESIDPVQASDEMRDKKKPETNVMILRNVEMQTEQKNENAEDKQLTIVKVQLKNLQNQLAIKDNQASEKERLLSEIDKELAETKKQLLEKKDQIAALEDTLRDIQNRGKIQTQAQHNGAAGDGAGIRNNLLDEQLMTLRMSLKTVQDKIKLKDIEIMKYQTLLKEDRDKHSLAAANLQQELIILRKALVVEQQNAKSFQQESAVSRQKSVAVEKYVSQVRALEKHLAELHTQQAQLKAQLQSAHQEATRWRQMAQDRLVAMQELGKSLNEQHNKEIKEISSYKTDYEKLKDLSEEELPRKPDLDQKIVGYIDPDILKLCREKDDKIEELQAKLKQIESGETEEKPNTCSIRDTSNLAREHEILRSKYETVVSRERSSKEEIRDLKEQLSKRSNLSARSQKSERSLKEQMQKRMNSLEREIDSLSDKLAQQQLINEKHKLTANEDFEKWKKQKYWQENCQKYKTKLQEREEDIQKLQQTCTGYRMLIERLEREKINLENRVKTLKMDQRSSVYDQEKELLKEENDRLACELATLQAKMEMRQQGAGTLSAALMQEKLEAQERKIAVLELSSKVFITVRLIRPDDLVEQIY